jgi:transcriptional regulator with XRE-family HTH domain
MIMLLDGEKLRKARGSRTQEEIVAAAGKVFTAQQLSAYEKGHYRPRPEVQAALLKALDVEFEEVASPVTPAKPTRKEAVTA